MEVFVVLFFILFFAVLAKNIAQFFKNEASPRLTVPAKIVDMRRHTRTNIVITQYKNNT